MYKRQIERNIKKAAGEGAADNYERITYEGYGPNGTAIIVKTLTDNKNRTASNVRNAFTKGSGNVGTPGCVSFMFDEKGQIIIDKEECDMDSDDLMMTVLDAGDVYKRQAYVGVISNKKRYWGVGVDADIIKASIEALVVAVNKLDSVQRSQTCKDERLLDITNYIYANYKEVTLDNLAAVSYTHLLIDLKIAEDRTVALAAQEETDEQDGNILQGMKFLCAEDNRCV